MVLMTRLPENFCRSSPIMIPRTPNYPSLKNYIHTYICVCACACVAYEEDFVAAGACKLEVYSDDIRSDIRSDTHINEWMFDSEYIQLASGPHI
ncbi:unnamed protein product [Larinioides sclopetarius]|uniref:Uncharacterized protein n=1 Tax=Larinioides sclopetarius TaxID=280406 RepID=A0AAV1ZHW5_9ARAC